MNRKKKRVKEKFTSLPDKIDDESENPTTWVFKSKSEFILATLIDICGVCNEDGILSMLKTPIIAHSHTCIHRLIIMSLIYLPIIFSHYIIGHFTHGPCGNIRKMMPLSLGLPFTVTIMSLFIAFYDLVVLRLSIAYTFYMIFNNGHTIFNCYIYSYDCYPVMEFDRMGSKFHPSLTPVQNYTALSTFHFIEDFSIDFEDLISVFSVNSSKQSMKLVRKVTTIIHFGVAFLLPLLVFFLASMKKRILVKAAVFAVKVNVLAYLMEAAIGLATPTIRVAFHVFLSNLKDYRVFLDWKSWLLAVNELIVRYNPFLVCHYHLAAFLHPTINTEVVSVEKWIAVLGMEAIKSVTSLTTVAYITEHLGLSMEDHSHHDGDLTFGLLPVLVLLMKTGTVVMLSFIFLTHSITGIIRMALLLNFSYASIAEVISKKKSYMGYFLSLWLLLMAMGLTIIDSKWVAGFLKVGVEPSLSIALAVLSTWETITIFYLYGVTRFADDFHFKVGKQPSTFFKFMWSALPLIFIASMGVVLMELQNKGMTSVPKSYESTYIYLPFWIVCGPLILGLLFVVIKFATKRNLMGLVTPMKDWGDPREKERIARKKYPPREECRFRRRYDYCKHSCLRYSKVLPALWEKEYDLRLGLEEIAFEFSPLGQRQF